MKLLFYLDSKTSKTEPTDSDIYSNFMHVSEGTKFMA